MRNIPWSRVVGLLFVAAFITGLVLFIRSTNNDKLDFNGDAHLSPNDLVADAAGYSGRTTYVDGQVTIVPDEIVSLTYRTWGGGTTFHGHTDTPLSNVQIFLLEVGNHSVVVFAGNTQVQQELTNGVKGNAELVGQLLDIIRIVHSNNVIQDYSNDETYPVFYRIDSITMKS